MNYKDKDEDLCDYNKKKSIINNKNTYNLYKTEEDQDQEHDLYEDDYFIELKNLEEKNYEKSDNIVKMYYKLLNYCHSNNLNLCENMSLDLLFNYISHLENS
jgi:hypothetical protein